jgi:hypothetical protein
MSLTDQGQASQGDRVKADRKESTSFFEEKKEQKDFAPGGARTWISYNRLRLRQLAVGAEYVQKVVTSENGLCPRRLAFLDAGFCFPPLF